MNSLKKTELALLIAFMLFMAPKAVQAGDAMQATLEQNGKLRLMTSEELKSTSGSHTLILQLDGNLVVYDSQRKAVWNSHTNGQGAVECFLQSDGNLVLKDRNGRVVWATNTGGYKNAKLVMQDDGNLVLYNKRGLAVWVMGRIKDRLSRGENLLTDEYIRSQNGKYTLRMQGDGNLVAYDQQGKALWNSNTAGSGATECILQGDGNLVLKDKNGRVAWTSNTDAYPNAMLFIKDDGNLVMSKESGTVFWSNGKINVDIKPGAPSPGGVLTKILHRDDAGSGRDAGEVLEKAVPISPATELLEGELSPDDDMDIYSIRLDNGSKPSLSLSTRAARIIFLFSSIPMVISSRRRPGE